MDETRLLRRIGDEGPREGVDVAGGTGSALNGQPLTRSWIGHEEIMAGGTLHFVMGAEPNTTWGAPAGARPYSMSAHAMFGR